MRITDISIQARNKDRVNISVDGLYRFSLDVYQVGELGLKIGKEYSEDGLSELETESQFGKLYGRALEYSLMRPHSAKEVRDYLWRKTRSTRARSRTTGQIFEKEGVSQLVADKVYERLEEKGYIDDEKFATFWVEYRNQTKGSSTRKLTNELRLKGVAASVIASALAESSRNDSTELLKVLEKKRSKYSDDQKLTHYLMRQGFSYDDIRSALTESDP